MSTHDAIVLGASLDGLAFAIRLADAGRDVVIIEPGELAGGVAAGESFHAGYRTGGTAFDTSCVRPEVLSGLGVLGDGPAQVQLRDQAPSMLVLEDDGPGLWLHGDATRTAEALAERSPVDAEGLVAFDAWLSRVGKPLAAVMNRTAPDVRQTPSVGTALQLLWTALSIRRLGGHDMLELMRALPMALRDMLDDHLVDPRLKAGLAGPALFGTWGGPWSPGTATPYILRHALRTPGIAGGAAALAEALVARAEAVGAQLKRNAPVEHIVIEDGAATGVALADGQTLQAPLVAVGGDPKAALLDWIAPRDLPVRVTEQIRVLRQRGIVAVLDLALNGRLELADHPGARIQRLQVADSIEALERAFDPVKYRQVADAPHLWVDVPTVEDPSLAPDGCDVVSVLIRGVPADPADGWSDETRAALQERTVATLAEHAPALPEQIVGARLRTPADLAEQLGLGGGHLQQAELAFDQLLSFRPAPTCAGPTTPIGGVVLCSAASHPGGHTGGTAGWLQAVAWLKA